MNKQPVTVGEYFRKHSNTKFLLNAEVITTGAEQYRIHKNTPFGVNDYPLLVGDPKKYLNTCYWETPAGLWQGPNKGKPRLILEIIQ